jgi:hypothetical protein
MEPPIVAASWSGLPVLPDKNAELAEDVEAMTAVGLAPLENHLDRAAVGKAALGRGAICIDISMAIAIELHPLARRTNPHSSQFENES